LLFHTHMKHGSSLY